MGVFIVSFMCLTLLKQYCRKRKIVVRPRGENLCSKGSAHFPTNFTPQKVLQGQAEGRKGPRLQESRFMGLILSQESGILMGL